MKKFIAQVIIETNSPLAIGSGQSTYDNDAIVARDFNFLPYIPGTGLIGIISSLFEYRFGEVKRKDFFGGEDEIYIKNDKETFKGSDVEISDALLVDCDGKVIQKVVLASQLSDLHKKFLVLPKREHVRINDRGVGDKHGKFDNEFVYKGARFKFEIELMAEGDNEWKFILNSLYFKDFLLGGGITDNYGQIKIISVKTRDFDLSVKAQFLAYLQHSSDLNKEFDGTTFTNKTFEQNWQNAYSLQLTTRAIHIGSGFGDSEVDYTNYKEYIIECDADNKPVWKYCYVIPGSSIKGVVAHRLAFYQNGNNCVETIIDNYRKSAGKENNDAVDNIFTLLKNKINRLTNSNISYEEKLTKLDEYKNDVKNIDFQIDVNTQDLFEAITGENNVAVRELFGSTSNFGKSNGNIGKVIFDDFYIPEEHVSETIFEHNSIDCYTAGTVSTALFSEKVLTPDIPITINVKINRKEKNNEQFIQANKILNKVIEDLKNGDLAIGGKTNKGYGFLKK